MTKLLHVFLALDERTKENKFDGGTLCAWQAGHTAACLFPLAVTSVPELIQQQDVKCATCRFLFAMHRKLFRAVTADAFLGFSHVDSSPYSSGRT